MVSLGYERQCVFPLTLSWVIGDLCISFVLGQLVSLIALLGIPISFFNLLHYNSLYYDFFVGAIAEITESLDGNRVFIARLLNTNSHVLVHPVPYFDKNIGRMASLNYDIVPTPLCFLLSI